MLRGNGQLKAILEGRTLKRKRRRITRTKKLDDLIEKPKMKRRNDKQGNNRLLSLPFYLCFSGEGEEIEPRRREGKKARK